MTRKTRLILGGIGFVMAIIGFAIQSITETTSPIPTILMVIGVALVFALLLIGTKKKDGAKSTIEKV